MQVYLLIEYGGQWEDYYEHIVGCYKDLNKAEKKKKKLEKENKESMEQKELCNSCPCYCGADKEDFSKVLCIKCKMEKDSIFDEYFCENAITSYDEESYRIDALEVIE